MNTLYFLHGLESSGRGTKGTYLKNHFPNIHCPDFTGPLTDRLDQFHELCKDQADLVLVGSSYGGLMAACHAIKYPQQVARIILLAPALNYESFEPPETKLIIPTLLVMGRDDDVCPPDLVEPLAKRTFSNLEIIIADDDHMLHNTFQNMNWSDLFSVS